MKKPKITIEVRTNYYDIRGSTKEDLVKQIMNLGPIDQNDGSKCTSLTDWKIFSGKRSDGCPVIKLDVVFTFPSWKQNNVVPGLESMWNRNLKALQIHEDGHKKIGIKEAKEINNVLYNSFVSNNPTEYQNQIEEIKKRYKALEIAYDKNTLHGRTQGVILP